MKLKKKCNLMDLKHTKFKFLPAVHYFIYSCIIYANSTKNINCSENLRKLIIVLTSIMQTHNIIIHAKIDLQSS